MLIRLLRMLTSAKLLMGLCKTTYRNLSDCSKRRFPNFYLSTVAISRHPKLHEYRLLANHDLTSNCKMIARELPFLRLTKA